MGSPRGLQQEKSGGGPSHGAGGAPSGQRYFLKARTAKQGPLAVAGEVSVVLAFEKIHRGLAKQLRKGLLRGGFQVGDAAQRRLNEAPRELAIRVLPATIQEEKGGPARRGMTPQPRAK